MKKTKGEVTKQKAEHLAKAKLKKERREEQERNVAAKKTKEDFVSEDEDGDWDGEADVSEVSDSDEESMEEEARQTTRPAKRRKVSIKPHDEGRNTLDDHKRATRIFTASKLSRAGRQSK